MQPQDGQTEQTLIQLAQSPDRLECSYPLAASAAEALHCWQARVGEILTLYDALQDRYYRGRLEEGRVSVRLFEQLHMSPEPPGPRMLVQAMPNRERLLWVIEKAVELGATAVQPVMSERSYHGDQAPAQDKRGAWQRIVAKAARQCRRAVLPYIYPPCGLEEVVIQGVKKAHRQWVLDISGEPPPWGVVSKGIEQGIVLYVGPEGGWSEGERRLFATHHVQPLQIGPRILRTETAAIAGLTLLAAADQTFTMGGG
uniref:16S rRNA (uracil(1498)-N(3))-methyltransferase n=1 Tax=Magnetococcus massalia (strain MO-1) TaxID=451514 RepID=A0A1S7LGT9_MAGMO|nr:Conserved protein of unknown function [Candidatus Magnetococcus massalia]